MHRMESLSTSFIIIIIIITVDPSQPNYNRGSAGKADHNPEGGRHSTTTAGFWEAGVVHRHIQWKAGHSLQRPPRCIMKQQQRCQFVNCLAFCQLFASSLHFAIVPFSHRFIFSPFILFPGRTPFRGEICYYF